ncbi:hypothetical protein Csal_2909 [Chromohalobacter israelensis DSM 3043]|uniref:Uncharacterized protein n=2 Tax=Chromohalobacter israelensis TaxID=141390 RepID=Q1QTF4_CHRI1|nr:hypothetical protein Csal_2909 [Chromohalobacter salexigens DSM 3043]
MKGVSFMGFVAPMIALFIAIVWIGVAIVGKNVNAKDLVFSYTALAAAFVMFSLNLGFSLKNEDSTHVVQPHLILTPNCVDVYSELLTKSNFVVFNQEKLSSSLNLARISEKAGLPQLSDDESAVFQKNLVEFLRVSVVGHLLSEYPDWNPGVKTFRGKRQVQFNNSEEGAGHNSYYSVPQMENALKIDVDDFDISESVGITNGLTLPPNTAISSNGENLIFENPHIRIEIDFEVEDGMSFAVPSYIGSNLRLDQRDLSQGVVNIQSNIRVSVSQKKQRSGSPERLKYKAWASQIVDIIRAGFSPVASQNA